MLTIFQVVIEQWKCHILFFDGLSMAFLHFVCKLLSNLWEHHITTMLSDVFCIRLLTSKNQFVHGLLIDVIVICSRVLRSIHEVRFRNELCRLPLMDIIFSTAKVLYNISGLSGLAIFQRPVHFPDTCPRFFFNGHNS